MAFTTSIKRLLYPLYILPRISRQKRDRLHQAFEALRHGNAAASFPPLRIFSNQEEDGIILTLLAKLGIREGFFLDLGSNDCINSNCASLVFHFNWKGIFVDADAHLLQIGKRNYRLFGRAAGLEFIPAFLHPDTVDAFVSGIMKNRELDFMSLDIDGNDYAIWKAIQLVRPKLLVIENKIEFGLEERIVPADPQFPADQWGASLASMVQLGKAKGYTLVATNAAGFNSFFLRNDLLEMSGLQELNAAMVVKG